MEKALATLLYGAAGGGLVSLGWRTIEKWWIDVRFSESNEARMKLRKYANPFWLACHDLAYRLDDILKKDRDESKRNEFDSLQLSPKEATGLEWYVKDGYFAVSTAYLVASVAAWIRIYQRDVVFLRFGKESVTAQFFYLVESLKSNFSSGSSILWYHYFNGIGDFLVKDSEPISFADFCHKLFSDSHYREYYDQLFQFLRHMRNPDYREILDRTLHSLRDIKDCLQKNGAVPEICSQSRSAQREEEK